MNNQDQPTQNQLLGLSLHDRLYVLEKVLCSAQQDTLMAYDIALSEVMYKPDVCNTEGTELFF